MLSLVLFLESCYSFNRFIKFKQAVGGVFNLWRKCRSATSSTPQTLIPAATLFTNKLKVESFTACITGSTQVTTRTKSWPHTRAGPEVARKSCVTEHEILTWCRPSARQDLGGERRQGNGDVYIPSTGTPGAVPAAAECFVLTSLLVYSIFFAASSH